MNIHCCHYSDQPSFLWSILFLYFVKHSIDEVMQVASSMYEQKFDFSANFEESLLKLWETREIARIFEIAKTVVEQRLFDIEKHVFIVATLVRLRKLSLADAAQFLNVEPPRDYANLDDRVRRVIDVAWLVNEDSKDRVMFPSDDSVLEEALREVTALFDKG